MFLPLQPCRLFEDQRLITRNETLAGSIVMVLCIGLPQRAFFFRFENLDRCQVG